MENGLEVDPMDLDNINAPQFVDFMQPLTGDDEEDVESYFGKFNVYLNVIFRAATIQQLQYCINASHNLVYCDTVVTIHVLLTHVYRDTNDTQSEGN